MIVIYCNDYFFTVDLALHRLSFWRGPVKPTINETFSETEVVTRGLYENQQGSNRQRNKKQATERKKKPTMRIALGPVTWCTIFYHKEWQQLPANLLCILLIPHWHNCQNITRQFHPHRRSLYLSQWARLNEVISHEFWQRIAEKIKKLSKKHKKIT